MRPLDQQPMMMKLPATATSAFVAHSAFAAANVGQPAPAFAAQDTRGRTVSLADFMGRHVVPE